jgi:hypothetical protein
MLSLRRTTLIERAPATQECLDGYNPCGQGLPANFCCSAGNECVALASNTTALCCPKGQDCSAIVPTTCDIELMNADDHPNSQILTTALDGNLPSCGNATCCPFGYECASSGGSLRCVMEKNQAAYTSLVSQQTKGAMATTSGSTTSPSHTPAMATLHSTSSIPVTSSTVTGTAASNAAGGIGADHRAVGSQSAGIIAGSVVAALVLLVGLAIIVWTKRRKHSNHTKNQPGAGSSSHQHQWQYQPPTYDISNAKPMTGSQLYPAKFCETLTSSPAYVSVAFTELEGSTPSQRPPSATHNAQSPVELPASPVSFSMWSRQQENRGSTRNSSRTIFMPPQTTFLPLSRFAAMQRHGQPPDGDNWI